MSREKISAAEYAVLQSQLLFLAGLIAELPDIGPFLSAIHRADSIGPIVDPTLWMRGHHRMDHIREIASAIATARVAILKHRTALVEELSKEASPVDVAAIQSMRSAR